MSRNSLGLTLLSWPPALLALFLQVTGLVVAAAALAILAGFGVTIHPLFLFIVSAGLAAGLSRRLGQPHWWQLINLGFLPLVWIAGRLAIAPSWYLAGFLLLVLTSAGALRTRVPLYLSSGRAEAALLDLIPAGKPLRVLDLGCGLGGILAHLARPRPDLRLEGVEAAPLPWLASRLRLAGRARIRLGSLWAEDLSRFDVVYAYLSPAPMARLWAKVEAEMRPGSLFVSNSFEVPGVAPQQIIELHDLNHSRLLVWRR